MFDHIKVGRLGEELARFFLKTNGYRILDTNWRSGTGEIDIVCEKNGILVFVEVKARKSKNFGSPEEFFNRKKQQKIIKTVMGYLTRHCLWNRKCRIDVISVLLEKDIWHIRHFKDVCEVSKALDSGHSYWQPW